MLDNTIFNNFDNIPLPKLRAIFDCLRPHLIAKFEEWLDARRNSSGGRNRTVDLSLIFKAFYSTIKDGTSSTNFDYYFGIPKSTYFYYEKLFRESRIIETLNEGILNNYDDNGTLFGDSFTVKSHKGSEGVGRNPTDRGRNGIKVQVISDEKGVLMSLNTAPANDHDSKIFVTSLPSIAIEGKDRDILLDSAYVGEKVRQVANSKRLNPLVVPKKKRNGHATHILNEHQREKVKKRWRVEQHIGMIRTNKGISNKYSILMRTYRFYLEFVKLLVNCYRIYVT